MIPLVFYIAPQPVQHVVYMQPSAVVVHQAAPPKLFAPRPQVFVIQSCAGGNCPK